MTLTELWADLKALPHTIGEPLRDRTWFRQHMVNHLVGGAVLFLLVNQILHNFALAIVEVLLSAGWINTDGDGHQLIALLWFPRLALWLVAGYTIVRQGFGREFKGPGEFPLYAMVWDSATSIGAAAVAALLVGLVRG